mgnify:CR=1 FL=1|tara:strand:- start:239 stop:628 length:390 start_codon:yes stop_codon:yes gene_type:complete
MITRIVTVNNIKLKTRVATTPREQAQGLMYDKSMTDDEGMLFEYPSERNLSFWMKNTKIPLSIAFIDSQGIINTIRDMEPFSLSKIKSTKPAKWALEVNRGWFDKYGVKVGDKINCGGKEVRIKIIFNK